MKFARRERSYSISSWIAYHWRISVLLKIGFRAIQEIQNSKPIPINCWKTEFSKSPLPWPWLFLIFAYLVLSSKNFHNQFKKKIIQRWHFYFQVRIEKRSQYEILKFYPNIFQSSWKVLFLHIFALIKTNETRQVFTRKPFSTTAKCNDDTHLNWFCSVTTDVTLYYPCSFTDDDRKYQFLQR